jgi:polyvinyl alcohol dehydrogenase (cytochrome)
MLQRLTRFRNRRRNPPGSTSGPGNHRASRRPRVPPSVEELERRDCPSVAGDWPMYNHDPAGSRLNPGESVLSPSTVGRSGLGVRWRFDTAGSVAGTPAVVNGVVYDGDLKGNFYAIRDTARGPVLLWQQNVGVPITDSPLVMDLPNGRSEVIFGDQAGFVYGLDAATGAVNWRVRPNTTSPAIAVYGSATPVRLATGATYVALGVASNEEGVPISPGHPRFSTRGSVVLLDPASGGVVWQTYTVTDAEFAAGASGAGVWSTPTYDPQAGILYVTTGNNYSAPATLTSDAVLALDAATGRILWTTQVTPDDTSNGLGPPSPSAPDFDFGDSAQIYQLPDGTRVVGAGQKSGAYYVLDASTGQVLHANQLETGGDLGGLFADSAVDERAGLVLANGIDWPHPETTLPTKGDLFAVSLDGTRVVWDFQTPFSPNFTGVAVANGVVYVQSLIDGSLYALDETSGALLSRVLTAGSTSGPAVANGRLYEGAGFAFGANVLNQQNVTGSIVAIGLGPSPPAVELATLGAEAQNLANIIEALLLNQQAAAAAAGTTPDPGAFLQQVGQDLRSLFPASFIVKELRALSGPPGRAEHFPEPFPGRGSEGNQGATGPRERQVEEVSLALELFGDLASPSSGHDSSAPGVRRHHPEGAPALDRLLVELLQELG